MTKNLLIVLAIPILSACSEKNTVNSSTNLIANGQMPKLVKDKNDNLSLVFGNGDSIMYAYSSDQGKSFSVPSLIAVIPKLAASHTGASNSC